MVKLLLKYNANVNAGISGNSNPLKTAVYTANVAIMKLLIAHGADVNGDKGIDSNVFPPLIAAASNKNLEVLELLLNNDMIEVNKVTKSNYTALHYGALCSDHCDMIQRLLDAGADVNLENDKGQTALDLIPKETSKVKCTIRKYIVKLCAANFYVSPGNFAAVDSKVYKKLRNQCTTEIEMMKKIYIGTSNLRFYDVLLKSRHVLASRLKYISDETVLNFDTKAIFPQ